MEMAAGRGQPSPRRRASRTLAGRPKYPDLESNQDTGIEGTLRIWAEAFVNLRVPKIFNLRLDPYERAGVTSNTYYDWLIDHAFLHVPRTGLRRQVPRDVQGLSATAESRGLQTGRGNADVERAAVELG